ncbi:MAG: cytochrome-c oxidase, cbb3-type subunit III [Alphaproteobacteria bacterium]|nr:MAG: cytochrome-c oxidase, cbb3-type subunit III [Alphaproteobacteria bacterium]
MSTTPDRDEVTGIQTTGHDWDGITELDQPLPRWWLIIFYLTIIGSVLFWVWYPSWPVWMDGEWTFTRGLAGKTARDDVAAEMAQRAAAREADLARLEKADLGTIRRDPELLRLALANGASAFGDNCAPCHGSGAEGGPGFPNLNDDDWLWGGRLSDIEQTITHGIRWEADPETRLGAMPAHLRDGLLGRADVADVVQFVLSLSGRARDAEAAARGALVFEASCAACHGLDAKGQTFVGAPNLSDDIWLYGGREEDIFESVANGRAGVMPAWGGRLDAATIKSLTLYVHGLGGGVEEEPAAAGE